ncbi:MAG: hypothetical protein JO219_12575 [Candidatus Eremiobacteraeota bacterium]|nr:hypothetical protein [Candidatus Eremiobacteraeota bacterium]MBV8366312.1 hypothetical protein [Candidatus Eremiobacteraeota bacterium]
MMLVRRLRLSASLSAAFLLTACGSNGCTPVAGVPPQQISRLYVAQSGGGTIFAYALPIGPGSQPIGASYNSQKHYVGIATDEGGAVYAANDDPALGASTWDSFVPFTGVTTPARDELTFAHPHDVAVDRASHVFVVEQCEADGPPCHDEMEVWTSPITLLHFQHSDYQLLLNGSPESLTFDAEGDLWAVFAHSPFIREYVPPISRSSTPVLQTDGGLAAPPSFVRADRSGNLYVVEQSIGVILYRPPFSPSMVPAETFSLSSGISTGVAIDADGATYMGNDQGATQLILAFFPTSTVLNTTLRPPLTNVGSLAIGQGPAGSPIPLMTTPPSATPTPAPSSTPTPMPTPTGG